LFILLPFNFNLREKIFNNFERKPLRHSCRRRPFQPWWWRRRRWSVFSFVFNF
jgi:hypothetical protein